MAVITHEERALFEKNGFLLVTGILTQESIGSLLDAIEARSDQDSYGIRNIAARIPAIKAMASSISILGLVRSILGKDVFLVQSIFFDKSPQANWKVPWHQDLTIPVKSRIPVPGFGPWSRKSNINYVQASGNILENLLILRLHLDDCLESNGPLKVLSGSHASGKLSREQIQGWTNRVDPVICCVPAGGILMMRPLLLHSSSAAKTPVHRRVIHLEYAADQLPFGLEWMAP